MKKEIRKQIIALRNQLSEDEIEQKSMAIFKTLLHDDYLNDHQTIMVFVDFKKEVSTAPILEYILNHGKTLVLPRVDLNTHLMTLHHVTDLKDLERSKFGILEPLTTTPIVDVLAIDLILSPGVAFDYEGFRLGYGGGFYDKLLIKKRKEVPVIALAFDLQIINKVPTEPHDLKVDKIITETTVIIPKV